MGRSAALYTLTLSDGASIAFRRTPAGSKSGHEQQPGVVFCGGFRSDMTGGKAQHLERHCRGRGQGFLRFDYTGHGESSGRFEDGTIGRWLDDTLAVIDRLTEGRQILVGSSMGGWIAALAALARPNRVAGLLTIAAAPDFTQELIWDRLSEDQRMRLLEDGILLRQSDYDDRPDPITLRLIEDGRDHLLLGAPVGLAIPVRLVHGMADRDVPWQQSQRLAEQITGSNVQLTLVEDGEHRLSRPSDLALIATQLDVLTSGLNQT